MMTLQDGIRSMVKGVDKTIFDPAVGEGQFPCTELVLKLFYSVGRLDEVVALRALKSLYGVDIQATSVVTAKKHLLATLCSAYKFFTGHEFTRLDEARLILNENIIAGDGLKLMRELATRQQSLF